MPGLEQDDEQEEDVLIAVLGPVADLALYVDKPVQALEVCLGMEEKIEIREGVSSQLSAANPVVHQLSLEFLHFFLTQQSRELDKQVVA